MGTLGCSHCGHELQGAIRCRSCGVFTDQGWIENWRIRMSTPMIVWSAVSVVVAVVVWCAVSLL